MNKIELAKKALGILSKIPENKWITEKYGNGTGCCAIGHYHRIVEGLKYKDIPNLNVIGINEEAGNLNCMASPSLASINDGTNLNYKQPTPKQRVIAFLNDVINSKA